MSLEYTTVELNTKEQMLSAYKIMHELYPELTQEEYSKNLDEMIPKSYKQVLVLNNEEMIGLSGYWIGTKLWCGKYLEMDNVVVSENYRGKGVANLLSEKLHEVAQVNNCKMMCLDAYTENLPALKFYVKAGFVPRGFHYIKHL